ncbi:hypothetical protein AB0M43_37835 [Longispora sp. NPDC051575]|uniref:hypothetical protein n=1 Tax=Longispora sp. NPDC051575 TaxID=3154943 RepID=UPI00342B9CF3
MDTTPDTGQALTPRQIVDLLPYTETPSWTLAHRRAQDLLGATIAPHIEWEAEYREDLAARWRYGAIGEGPDRIQFRYDIAEPGNEFFQMRVPCPADPQCRQCWQDLERGDDLGAILDSAEPNLERECETHEIGS